MLVRGLVEVLLEVRREGVKGVYGAGLRGHGEEAACGALVEAEGACCQCYD